jgi:micrococcal nuclease
MFGVLVLAVWRFVSWPARPVNVRFEADSPHKVARVIDGDTLELANGDRVRLIGVDTPEYINGRPEPFAVEATAFTRRLVAGKTVRLQFDKERLDKYRRILAFVYIDDILLNEELVTAGLARVLTQYGYSSRMKKRLLKAQAEAQRREVNLWKSGG